ncbi:MAG TPA: ATP-binding protein [Kofleriaceae bacterium]|jgi:signal transduction histidine kinase|nr:ATP-binding protein [Kofleriaceae bacterium]
MAIFDRLLSRGVTDAIPEQLARYIRVTNALALLGIVLSLTGLPVDSIGASPKLVVIDLVCIAGFLSVWVLNSRGYYTASRVLLAVTSNGVMIGGMLEVGGPPELRTVFLPLALLPFLIFGVSERLWLAGTVLIPVVAYFLTARLEAPPSLALSVDTVYAPVLAFAMIIAGAAVFAYVQRSGEEKLVQARARAAQGARLAALGEMSSGIAHEIRNPLAAINIAASQIVELSTQPAQVAELGERIQRVVMRASRIIEGLRSFSRDASGDPLVPARVDRVIADTLELCGKRLTDKGVELTIADVSPDLVVQCRPVQLSQVLMNLLGNAYDAVSTAQERWIRLDVHADGGWLEIAVSDSGPGIPKELKSRIFEPFFTTKDVDRGTGLGLSLSRGIVETHQGTLELDTSSKHTRLAMRIPLAQAAALE